MLGAVKTCRPVLLDDLAVIHDADDIGDAADDAEIVVMNSRLMPSRARISASNSVSAPAR